MFDFIEISKEMTFTKANHTLITCGNAVCSLFNLNKNISLNADRRACAKQIHFETMLCTMKIDHSLIIYDFHSERHWNDIWKLTALQSLTCFELAYHCVA